MRIGIVGAGATGTSVLDTLARLLPDGAAVTVFEGDRYFGPGRAYRPGSGAALVNLTAPKMSLRPDQPGHFQDWLPADHPEFVSRELYGRYLTELFTDAADRLGATLIGEYVVAIARVDGSYVVRTGQAAFTFDAVFLCVGAATPSDVYELAGTPGFVADPYPLDTMPSLSPEASVTVLGTGLSAVDAVLELIQRGHRGRLRMVSRSGYLPGVRDTRTKPVLRSTGAEVTKELSLLDLYRMVSGEFRAQKIPMTELWQEFQSGEDPAARLRRQYGQVLAGAPALPVFLAVAGHLLEHQAWRLFGDETRAVFLRDWHGLVATLCAPMPARTARRLVGLLDDGLLRVSAGLTGIHAHHNGYTVSTGQGDFETSYVVNTIRPNPVPLPGRAAELIGSLLAGELADTHPLGGLRLDAETATALDGTGMPSPGLYVLGELAIGELYVETTVLTAITHRVGQAVHHLLGRSSKGAA
ncbi:FAD/NAD(P)-binding protein [Streptomyces sp. SID13031]|uniref:FAD/NAD(P)-binding protein n=1 Tax=Streptomyces sp. SID13031 TaxID=2706046 RepID=UPI0013C87E78|nr:FAD/NAD(P)-binding protein [Streptomyces sp. SID13031]NEA30610.1 hypothetical protein [Streptomyces sp. SID13031]